MRISKNLEYKKFRRDKIWSHFEFSRRKFRQNICPKFCHVLRPGSDGVLFMCGIKWTI